MSEPEATFRNFNRIYADAGLPGHRAWLESMQGQTQPESRPKLVRKYLPPEDPVIVALMEAEKAAKDNTDSQKLSAANQALLERLSKPMEDKSIVRDEEFDGYIEKCNRERRLEMLSKGIH